MREHDGQELDLIPAEGDRPIPVGWRLLFWGLIAFGAYYLIAYTPAITGWTQAGDLEASGGAGGNVFATILFTALAAIAAAAILAGVARKRKGGA